MTSIKDRIIVALDVDTEREAVDLVTELGQHVWGFKVGLELLNSVGINIVHRISTLGTQVLLDGKFNDIPSTVAGAARAVTRLAVRMFTVHTLGGLDMMKAAVEATGTEAARLGIDRPLILGVTVLTSLDRTMLNKELRVPGSVETQVTHLAGLADRAGLDGVVASPNEIEQIRAITAGRLLILTPGVRPSWAGVNDQKRVLTPSEAIFRGSSYLVIGRPITKPPADIGSRIDAVKRIVQEISIGMAN